MKPAALSICAVLAAGLFAGCRPSERTTGSQTAGPTAQQRDTAEAVAQNAAEQVRNQVFAQRAGFVTAMQAQWAGLNRNLDTLSDRIAQTGSARQAEARPKLAALRNQATQLKRLLGDVTNATPVSWGVIKAQAEATEATLRDGLAQLQQWLGDEPTR